LPVGATLPSDAYCTAHVRAATEVRPANATANHTTGGATSASAGPLFARVTGSFVGTTDEILQWGACKWGLDEDIVRAQTAKESWWLQSAAGDWTTDPTRCAPGHTLGSDGVAGQCPESIGLLQVRFPYWPSAFPAAGPSSSYNVDYALASWRSCFEGQYTWLNQFERGQDYAAGDAWGCVGVWFAGRWHTPAADAYVVAVQAYLAQRIWTTPAFLG
jgi:autotransporter family porin